MHFPFSRWLLCSLALSLVSNPPGLVIHSLVVLAHVGLLSSLSALFSALTAPGYGRPLEEDLRIEAECFNRNVLDPEMVEGLRRFRERDHPDLANKPRR